MKLRNNLPSITLALVSLGFGLMAGGSVFSYYTSRSVRQLKEEIRQLKKQNEELHQENKQLSYIRDLAMEFSMDPVIVSLVDRYSHEFLKKDEPEWRFLRTPEFMTYIMLSLIYVESKGDPNIIGDGDRARGLTQIWVSTARDYGKVTAQQLLDPETNIAFSFKHFHHLLKRYKGDLALALCAWNRGHGTVDRLLSYGQWPLNGYGKKVYEGAKKKADRLTEKADLLTS